MKNPNFKNAAWTPALREEIIAALWFNAAFTALGAGCNKWIVGCLFIKASLDVLCAIGCALREIAIEAKSKEASQ